MPDETHLDPVEAARWCYDLEVRGAATMLRNTDADGAFARLRAAILSSDPDVRELIRVTRALLASSEYEWPEYSELVARLEARRQGEEQG